LSNSLSMRSLPGILAGAVLMAAMLLAGQAAAEPRLALVIGNGAYETVTPLDNPVNDAGLMAQALKKAGFDVTLITEATQDKLILAISAFGRKLRDAGAEATGLFYYAGHGVQSFGANYLLPVDIELHDAADLSLVGVPAQAVLRQMFSARNRTNIVILDACRNNPFVSIPDLSDNGLAEMKAPRGTFLAYSTAPGEIALDGDGTNSPFTKALAERLQTPGIAIESLFKDVRIEVLKSTGGNQTPWDTSSLIVDFQFSPATAPTAEVIQLRQLWDSVRLSQDPIQVLLFLRANPDSPYTEDARALLADLMSKEISPGPAPAQPVVEAPAPPAPVDPDKDEREMIEAARTAGTAEAYEEYLKAFPEGAFTELARLELQTILQQKPKTDPVSEPPAAPPPMPEPAAPEPNGEIAFNAPLGVGSPEIASRSIAELITGSPLFPPIEGLPEEVWKDKTCAACHHWEQSNLCDQAHTYLADNQRSLSKQHPYGSAFKDALRVWARGGCQ